MSTGGAAARPADMVAGLTTPDGWYVESLIAPAPGATGGHFSSTYTAVKDGHRAFLKALDYVAALAAPDPARALQQLTTAFNFERDLVRTCEARGMRNVVRVLGDGNLDVPNAGPPSRVSYLVFELAEGDIRRYRALAGEIEVAWALRTVHQASLGLSQLHSSGIAHQDLKPSNLLLFDGGQRGKLGDLGRASVQSETGPYDNLHVAGDVNYAPPEFLSDSRLTMTSANCSSWPGGTADRAARRYQPRYEGLLVERAEFVAALGTPKAQRAMRAYQGGLERTGELPLYDRAALDQALKAGPTQPAQKVLLAAAFQLS